MAEGAEVLGGIQLSHSVPSCHDTSTQELSAVSGGSGQALARSIAPDEYSRGASVHVADVPFFGHKFLTELESLLPRKLSVLLCDREQRAVDVFGHTTGVTTHVKMCALIEPPPQLCALFHHAVLDVDAFGLVARECEVESAQ
ncbi:Uncharacterised protein [Mycobacteroides abscessus subsp. abscessus]|nr:Uncharacterised protein [Mycobacteroides abscessus subsp. abscessus]